MTAVLTDSPSLRLVCRRVCCTARLHQFRTHTLMILASMLSRLDALLWMRVTTASPRPARQPRLALPARNSDSQAPPSPASQQQAISSLLTAQAAIHNSATRQPCSAAPAAHRMKSRLRSSTTSWRQQKKAAKARRHRARDDAESKLRDARPRRRAEDRIGCAPTRIRCGACSCVERATAALALAASVLLERGAPESDSPRCRLPQNRRRRTAARKENRLKSAARRAPRGAARTSTSSPDPARCGRPPRYLGLPPARDVLSGRRGLRARGAVPPGLVALGRAPPWALDRVARGRCLRSPGERRGRHTLRIPKSLAGHGRAVCAAAPPQRPDASLLAEVFRDGDYDDDDDAGEWITSPDFALAYDWAGAPDRERRCGDAMAALTGLGQDAGGHRHARRRECARRRGRRDWFVVRGSPRRRDLSRGALAGEAAALQSPGAAQCPAGASPDGLVVYDDGGLDVLEIKVWHRSCAPRATRRWRSSTRGPHDNLAPWIVPQVMLEIYCACGAWSYPRVDVGDARRGVERTASATRPTSRRCSVRRLLRAVLRSGRRPSILGRVSTAACLDAMHWRRRGRMRPATVVERAEPPAGAAWG